MTMAPISQKRIRGIVMPRPAASRLASVCCAGVMTIRSCAWQNATELARPAGLRLLLDLADHDAGLLDGRVGCVSGGDEAGIARREQRLGLLGGNCGQNLLYLRHEFLRRVRRQRN